MKGIIPIWDQAGSISWRWLIGLAALLGLIAAAFVVMSKSSLPARAPAVVRAKIPALSGPHQSRSTAALNPASNPQPAHPAAMRSEALVDKTAGARPAPETVATAPMASGQTADASGAKPADSGQRTGAEPHGASTPAHVAVASAPHTPNGPVTVAPALPPAMDRSAGDTARHAEAPPAPDRSVAATRTAREKRTPAATVARVAPFTVQVGAFHNKANADRLLARLRKRGYAPFIFIAAHARKNDLYIVRFGRFASRKDAAEAAASFKRKENMAAVVARSGAL